MRQKDRFLVTGGTGFLGTVIVNSLKEKGMTVHMLGRSAGNDFVDDLAKPFVFPGDPFFDVVIHAAGKAHMVPKTEKEKKEFFDVNFEGTKKLCYALENLSKRPSSFIFISTVAVYGLDEGMLINEAAPLQGNTPYALSKIKAEEWLKEWAVKNNIVLTILRLPLIAGKNPPGNLGAMIDGIKRGRYFSIGKATTKKSIVWANDIAAILPAVAPIGGIYNLNDGYHPSFGELENTIALFIGKNPPLKIPMAAARVIAFIGDLIGSKSPINTDKLMKITSTLTFDDTKARQMINWKPSNVLDELPGIL